MVNPVVKMRPHRGIIYHPVQQRQQHIPIRLLLLRSTPSAGVGVGAICTNIQLSRFMRSAPRGFAIRFIFSGWSQPFPLFQVIEASTYLRCLLRQRYISHPVPSSPLLFCTALLRQGRKDWTQEKLSYFPKERDGTFVHIHGKFLNLE